VSLKCPPGLLGRCIAVHVDNARDIANKVSLLIFRAGKATAAAAGGAAAAEEAGQAAAAQLTVLKTVEVESRHAGWILCFLTDSETSSSAASHHQQQQQHNILRVEIRGPDNTVRLRQVKLIGKSAAEDELAGGGLLLGTPVVHLPNRAESARIQQANCEAETLRVFRLITSQVFGKLLEPDAEAENPGPGEQWNGTDLKQHVVGILFSRWVHWCRLFFSIFRQCN
jgi:E3 ubiquitin-protein ligase MYCBP2